MTPRKSAVEPMMMLDLPDDGDRCPVCGGLVDRAGVCRPCDEEDE